MSADDTKPCASCGGTGEQYRPDLGPCYTVELGGDPWVDCPDCHGYSFEQSEHSRRHAIAILDEYRRSGWPAFFRADVEVHDMNQCAERDPDLPFGWFTRESGSMVVCPEYPAPNGFTSGYLRTLASSPTCSPS